MLIDGFESVYRLRPTVVRPPRCSVSTCLRAVLTEFPNDCETRNVLPHAISLTPPLGIAGWTLTARCATSKPGCTAQRDVCPDEDSWRSARSQVPYTRDRLVLYYATHDAVR